MTYPFFLSKIIFFGVSQSSYEFWFSDTLCDRGFLDSLSSSLPHLSSLSLAFPFLFIFSHPLLHANTWALHSHNIHVHYSPNSFYSFLFFTKLIIYRLLQIFCLLYFLLPFFYFLFLISYFLFFIFYFLFFIFYFLFFIFHLFYFIITMYEH